jgi:hypothetical protein
MSSPMAMLATLSSIITHYCFIARIGMKKRRAAIAKRKKVPGGLKWLIKMWLANGL